MRKLRVGTLEIFGVETLMASAFIGAGLILAAGFLSGYAVRSVVSWTQRQKRRAHVKAETAPGT
ncbi:MAG TPA: hypothetical protein DCL54_18295 [Alphaproteobacteria bacterium]|nr:hypothetical protein [Alphaproteobacteria bacterium]HAJ48532.1 hypothetical protein [Alphaproteobacteria bacterium]